MNPEEPASAQRVVSEYAALLERHAGEDLYPAPVGSLPYPKETIKASIRTSFAALLATGQLTTELHDFLEVAYVSLADYVEEDLLRLMREYQQTSADLQAETLRGKEQMSTAAWTALAASGGLVGEVAKSIADETERLRQEFRSFAAVGNEGVSERPE